MTHNNTQPQDGTQETIGYKLLRAIRMFDYAFDEKSFSMLAIYAKDIHNYELILNIDCEIFISKTEE